MTATPKVFLIGLDGGTFRVIKPAIASGKLPILKQLINSGASGILTSTIPPATIPAFPTLMTGMNPGKHGIFDFMQTEGGRAKLVDGTNIQGQTLWRTLSDYGKRCIVLNVPLTYPPEKIDGVIVSGMMTPEGRSFTHPAHFAEILDNITTGYPVRFESSIAERNLKQFVENLQEMVRKRRTAIQFFLNQEKWDLFTILFRATDIVQHHLWRNQKAVIQVYEQIDSIIGELQEQEPGATFFIFSDHGFSPLVRSFHVNIYLRLLGLLSIKIRESSKDTSKPPKPHQLYRESIVERTLNRIGVTRARIRGFLPSKVSRVVSRFFGSRIRRYVPATHIEVDITKSKAYFSKTVTAETQSILLNAENSEEYENLVNLVKRKMREFRDPQTHKSVVKEIYHRDEIYHGPFAGKAPDLVMLLEEGYKATTTLSGMNITEEVPLLQGTHEINGIFIAAGPEIKQKYQVSEIHIQDLAPTILHLMQVSIPKDVDGKVKKVLFTESSKPFQKDPQFFTPKLKPRRIKHLSRDEEEEIKDRLRNLGYLD